MLVVVNKCCLVAPGAGCDEHIRQWALQGKSGIDPAASRMNWSTLFRRLNSSRALTTASRFVFAPVKRMASANASSGISMVVFTESKLAGS